MQKIEFHCHSNLDPCDGPKGNNSVKYSPEQLFKELHKHNYTCLALTHHKEIIFSQKLKNTAKKYDILLIKAVEAVIEGKEVLLLNPSKKITTFKELKREKKANKKLFVIAPHPYYPGKKCLKKGLETHIELFDAVENCHFHIPLVNFWNKKAQKIAKKHNKPFLSTGDTHSLKQLNRSYAHVQAKHDDLAIFTAIRQNKFKNTSKHLALSHFLSMMPKLIPYILGKTFK